MTSSPNVAQPGSPRLGADAIELVPSRLTGHGFHFRVRASGRIYRLDPERDPDQPRFWCVRVSRCTPAGMVDATEPPWYGCHQMTREDVPPTIAAIRTALAIWLALPQHGDLRAWVLEAQSVTPLPAELAPAAAHRPRPV